ncbi:MAG: hypothetical protein J6C98_06275 [Oscillospiraceae bacterium]|nr:hypothetical protein [Oscillospiraceae bacterium]
MRKKKRFGIYLIAAALVLSGCSRGGPMGEDIQTIIEGIRNESTAPDAVQSTQETEQLSPVNETDYLQFLKGTGYTSYAILDINADGVPEMLATDVAPYEYASGCDVDVYMWKGGSIIKVYEELWPKYVPLEYDRANKWLKSSTGGTGGGGYVYLYLDENLEVRTEAVEYYTQWDENFNESEHVYYNFVDITGTECEPYDRILKKIKSEDTEEIRFKNVPDERCASGVVTDSCPDGDYAVNYDADSLFMHDGELYLTFTYCGYYLHDKQDILSLQPGDRFIYFGEEVLVEDIQVMSWSQDGQEMCNVWINDYSLGLSSEDHNPDMLMELEPLGDRIPRYYDIDTLTLKLRKDMCMYDESKNPQPDMVPAEVAYENLLTYFLVDYYGGSPVSTIVTVENNEIVSIKQGWLS